MENNLLTGTLHGQTILQMSHLETLSLSDNDLSGLIPGEELGSLPTLHYLYLDTNHFIGPLPPQLAQVGKASLLELWAQDNALSGTVPASYVRFDKLHDFFIDGNKLTGELPPDLCGPEINADFFTNVPPEAERNYCDGIACPAGSVAFEGVFPCEKCPGGEAARLKNRYLGQTGECSNYSQRDVLKIIHKATTKGGPWNGVSDWNDDDKPVCEMTGITCDAYDHIVEIALKNRGLEGHIPDEIGSLTFLESLDVSDNELMGYVPSDLQWTSITNLDISGNKIRGMVPPLLCMMDELNGNGSDNVFYCDRIACPEGTYNENGFHHGSSGGEVCRPCYDETPFIGQKTCSRTTKPLKLVQMAEDASEKMGVSPMIGLGIVVGISLVILMACYVAKNAYYNPRKEYERGTTNDHHEHSGKSTSRNFKNEKAYNYNEEEEEGEDNNGNDIYSFADGGKYGQRRYKDSSSPGVYRDFVIEDEENNNNTSSNSPAENTVFVDYEDDDDKSRATTRSATDLMMDHQGVALNRREKLKKAVSGRMLPRSVRDAASTINVNLRRNSARKSFDENDALTPGSSYESPYETTESPNDDVPANLELKNNNDMKRKSYGKMNTGDLLDVPMIC